MVTTYSFPSPRWEAERHLERQAGACRLLWGWLRAQPHRKPRGEAGQRGQEQEALVRGGLWGQEALVPWGSVGREAPGCRLWARVSAHGRVCPLA